MEKDRIPTLGEELAMHIPSRSGAVCGIAQHHDELHDRIVLGDPSGHCGVVEVGGAASNPISDDQSQTAGKRA